MIKFEFENSYFLFINTCMKIIVIKNIATIYSFTCN